MAIRKPNWLQPARTTLALAITTTCIVTTGAILLPALVPFQPAFAQRIRPDGVWRQVYQQLPTLPLENQYINKETKKVDPENTLAGRLIRYHLYTKGRPPFYRLDWKLTLADYLGLNGVLEESAYPSANTLNKNPMEADVAAIRKLNRAQREALIQTLVDAFSPQTQRRSIPNSQSTTPNAPSQSPPRMTR